MAADLDSTLTHHALQRLHKEQDDISSTYTVCVRAMGLYKKTVEKPSAQVDCCPH